MRGVSSLPVLAVWLEILNSYSVTVGLLAGATRKQVGSCANIGFRHYYPVKVTPVSAGPQTGLN